VQARPNENRAVWQPLLITIKLTAKETFHTAAMLFCIYKSITKICIVFHNILQCISLVGKNK
jgi:hypothetical protein